MCLRKELLFDDGRPFSPFRSVSEEGNNILKFRLVTGGTTLTSKGHSDELMVSSKEKPSIPRRPVLGGVADRLLIPFRLPTLRSDQINSLQPLPTIGDALFSGWKDIYGERFVVFSSEREEDKLFCHFRRLTATRNASSWLLRRNQSARFNSLSLAQHVISISHRYCLRLPAKEPILQEIWMANHVIWPSNRRAVFRLLNITRSGRDARNHANPELKSRIYSSW